MPELLALVQIATVIAVMVVPIVAAVRIVAGDALGPTAAEPLWPHGVQEEDPRRWALVARGSAASS